MLHDANGITKMVCHYITLMNIHIVDGLVTLIVLCYIYRIPLH